MGPSWYLMPDVFERFFGHFGREPSEFYELERLDPHYRVFWKDGDQVDVLPDREANRELFEAYEPGAGEAFDEYLAESKHTYEVGMEHFVYKDRPRLRDYVDRDVMRHSWGLSLLGKMQGHVEDYFDHPKLQQLMQYTLVFLGGSPYNTPALYNLMSHVDYNMGVYYPDGGVGAVVDGIVELAEDLGVEFVTDAEVTGIEGRRGGFAVDTVNDDRYLADLVVSDADYAHTEQELLPEQKRQYTEAYWESKTYAPSAFLLYLGVEGDVPDLAHHTLVLPTDWDEHFAQIFDDPAWPDDPAYYLCVPSKTDDAVAPEATATSLRWCRSRLGSRTRPNSARRFATSSSTTSRKTPTPTSEIGSSSRRRSRSTTLRSGTTATRGARSGSHTRSLKRRCCGRRTTPMRSTGSTSPGRRRLPASASRCASSAGS